MATAGTHIVLRSLLCLASSSLVAPAQTTVVTKDLTNSQGAPGSEFISWSVSGSWQTGQFANGDWWIVVPIGQTAQVTSVTFGPNAVPYQYVPNFISVGGVQQPKVRSGSMKNPRSSTATYTNIYLSQ